MSSSLPRLFHRATNSGRRSYSFSSSKPGGGRYFTPNKVPKLHASAPTQTSNSASAAGSGSVPTIDKALPGDSGSTSTAESQPSSSTYSHESIAHVDHPTVSPHDVKLHHFFSLHRPMLSFTLPTPTLFISHSQLETQSSLPEDAEEEQAEFQQDADADIVRQLSRSLAQSKIGEWAPWERSIRALGGPESLSSIQGISIQDDASGDIMMDSTKRKRRRKMNKHQLKKRRRLERAQRLRMGK